MIYKRERERERERKRDRERDCISGVHTDNIFQVNLVCLFEFELYFPVNSYGHVGTLLPFYRTAIFFKYLGNFRKSKRISFE